jgi:hypothetical protein
MDIATKILLPITKYDSATCKSSNKQSYTMIQQS